MYISVFYSVFFYLSFSIRVHGVSILGMKCGKVASDWICKYLGKDGLYIVVSTPNMTKRDISEMKTKPWLNPPTIDDKVSMIDYCISLSLN